MPDSIPPHGDALMTDMVRRFSQKRWSPDVRGCRNRQGTSGVRSRKP
nr:hypothetical protein [uncultured Rhodopila sp.]